MKISGALFAAGLLVGVSFQSAAHYYWHDGQKVELQLIADKIAVSVPASSGESVEIPEGTASVAGRVADADLSILLCVRHRSLNFHVAGAACGRGNFVGL